MPFISYAQNFEDVVLWRALKGIKRGSYIDVGANHPVVDSVTYAFYERGWRGINIEPAAADFALLAAERPGDINLNVAAGSARATLPLFQFGVRGLSTLSSAVTEHHRRMGLEAKSVDVPVVPLSEICEQHVSGDLHFLKIDVEGSEAEVIRGMDFNRWRPWIMVVEATLPNSQQPTHAEWEPLLTEAGYLYCSFDGLSRFYVAREKEAELRPALSRPANVFDGFILASQVADREELARLRAEVEEQQKVLRQVTDAGTADSLRQALARIEALQEQLSAAREAWTMSQVTADVAQREAATLRQKILELENDPYFRTGVALRDLARRIRR